MVQAQHRIVARTSQFWNEILFQLLMSTFCWRHSLQALLVADGLKSFFGLLVRCEVSLLRFRLFEFGEPGDNA